MNITKDDITGTEVSEVFETKVGHEVKIYAVYAGVIHGAFRPRFDYWSPEMWDIDGRQSDGHTHLDLVEIPTKPEPLRGRVCGNEFYEDEDGEEFMCERCVKVRQCGVALYDDEIQPGKFESWDDLFFVRNDSGRPLRVIVEAIE